MDGLDDNPFAAGGSAMKTASAAAAAAGVHAGSSGAAAAAVRVSTAGGSVRPSAASPGGLSRASAKSPSSTGVGGGGFALTQQQEKPKHVPVPDDMLFGPPELPASFAGQWSLDSARSDKLSPYLEELGVLWVTRKLVDSFKVKYTFTTEAQGFSQIVQSSLGTKHYNFKVRVRAARRRRVAGRPGRRRRP